MARPLQLEEQGNTTNTVLPAGWLGRSFALRNKSPSMTSIGERFVDRSRKKDAPWGPLFEAARLLSGFESSFDAWGYVQAGDHIPYLANHQANLRIALGRHRGSVSTNANHTGRMATQAGTAPDHVQEGIPAYPVIAMAVMREAGGQAEALATVQNILDQVYLVSLVPASGSPGMPRAIQAGLRFRS